MSGGQLSRGEKAGQRFSAGEILEDPAAGIPLPEPQSLGWVPGEGVGELQPKNAARRAAGSGVRPILGEELDLPGIAGALGDGEWKRGLAELDKGAAVGMSCDQEFTSHAGGGSLRLPDGLAFTPSPIRSGQVDGRADRWRSAAGAEKEEEDRPAGGNEAWPWHGFKGWRRRVPLRNPPTP